MGPHAARLLSLAATLPVPACSLPPPSIDGWEQAELPIPPGPAPGCRLTAALTGMLNQALRFRGSATLPTPAAAPAAAAAGPAADADADA